MPGALSDWLAGMRQQDIGADQHLVRPGDRSSAIYIVRSGLLRLYYTDSEGDNIWFWDEQKQIVTRLEVEHDYFDELMTLRSCEWALKADPGQGKAIGLWLAAYFRAESYGIDMPGYFGEGHAKGKVVITMEHNE